MALVGAVIDELFAVPFPNANPVEGNPATGGGSDFFSSSALGDKADGPFALTVEGAPKVNGAGV